MEAMKAIDHAFLMVIASLAGLYMPTFQVNLRTFVRGGIRFVRLGRISISVCVVGQSRLDSNQPED